MRLLEEGQEVRDKYVIERYLGEGAFAEVYRVKHRFLGRQAMKVFKAVGMTVEETEQLLSEAIILSQIGHPNIVRVFDADIVETPRGRCGFFTMEYVAGGSLESFWKNHGSRYVPTDTALDIISQVCQGLSLAHGQGFVHRDIKPQNILIGYDNAGLRVRVGDFGLARKINTLTMLATTRGTIDFKAPEALRDLRADSMAGDVWALGTTLYLLLTDRLPFGSANGGMERFELPFVPPSRLNAQVDARIDQLLLRALAVDPSTRFANASALLASLNAIREHAPPPEGAIGAFSEVDKNVLGARSMPDEDRARSLVTEAIALAKSGGKLGEAADMLEEALNQWPPLREDYAQQLRLWRCGISNCIVKR